MSQAPPYNDVAEHLERRLGRSFHKATVVRMLSGERKISADELFELASLCNVSLPSLDQVGEAMIELIAAHGPKSAGSERFGARRGEERGMIDARHVSSPHHVRKPALIPGQSGRHGVTQSLCTRRNERCPRPPVERQLAPAPHAIGGLLTLEMIYRKVRQLHANDRRSMYALAHLLSDTVTPLFKHSRVVELTGVNGVDLHNWIKRQIYQPSFHDCPKKAGRLYSSWDLSCIAIANRIVDTSVTPYHAFCTSELVFADFQRFFQELLKSSRVQDFKEFANLYTISRLPSGLDTYDYMEFLGDEKVIKTLWADKFASIAHWQQVGLLIPTGSILMDLALRVLKGSHTQHEVAKYSKAHKARFQHEAEQQLAENIAAASEQRARRAHEISRFPTKRRGRTVAAELAADTIADVPIEKSEIAAQQLQKSAAAGSITRRASKSKGGGQVSKSTKSSA